MSVAKKINKLTRKIAGKCSTQNAKTSLATKFTKLMQKNLNFIVLFLFLISMDNQMDCNILVLLLPERKPPK